MLTESSTHPTNTHPPRRGVPGCWASCHALPPNYPQGRQQALLFCFLANSSFNITLLLLHRQNFNCVCSRLPLAIGVCLGGGPQLHGKGTQRRDESSELLTPPPGPWEGNARLDTEEAACCLCALASALGAPITLPRASGGQKAVLCVGVVI